MTLAQLTALSKVHVDAHDPKKANKQPAKRGTLADLKALAG